MHIIWISLLLYTSYVFYRFEKKVGGVEWRWLELTMVRFRVLIRRNQGTISNLGSAGVLEGWREVIRQPRNSRTSVMYYICDSECSKNNYQMYWMPQINWTVNSFNSTKGLTKIFFLSKLTFKASMSHSSVSGLNVYPLSPVGWGVDFC